MRREAGFLLDSPTASVLPPFSELKAVCVEPSDGKPTVPTGWVRKRNGAEMHLCAVSAIAEDREEPQLIKGLW